MTIQHRRSTCHRHPSTPVTGFCAPCLSERLVGLDSAADAGSLGLRRSKSCCSNRPDRLTSDPTRRKSCDVRNRSTLSELFHVDDDGGGRKRVPPAGKFILEEAAAEEEENGDAIRVSEAEEKTMKELIDLEMQRKKGNGGRDLREMAGAVWETASKKVKRWRRKKKEKKQLGSSEVGEYALGRRSCDTEYALGRRSCDTDVDPGRMSLDEPHRASWDGYLSTRAYPRMTPMVAVAEDLKINEEDEEGLEGLERSPGGSAQTQDYYFSQTRRRRSFEKPSSCLPSKGVMVGEVEGVKVIDNDATGLFYGAKVVFTEKELMGSSSSNSKSVEEDCVAGGCGVGIEGICGNSGGVSSSGVDQKPQKWHKRWKFWGQRKSQLKVEDESWEKLRREANATVSQKLIRSYSVSCRKSCKMVGLFSNVSSVESKGNGLTTLQRNRSARYSPSNLDHGLLRFYLTPLRSFRKNESGKSRLQNNHSMQNLAKSMF